MNGIQRFGWIAAGALLLAAAPAFGRDGGAADHHRAEREQRRQELRQQLESERARWRHEGRPGERAGPGGPAWAEPRHPGHPGAGRLSPEERRALRETLREHRP